MRPTGALRLEDRVQVGVRVTGLSRASALEEIRRIESSGYDSLWVTDHLAFHVPVTDALALLAFAASITERVTLGTSVYLLPLRSAIATAKQAASVDMLSQGRLVLGVGVGGEYAPEFEAAGVPVSTRGARTDETIPLLRRLWTEKRVEHAGRFARFGPLQVAPRPVQRAGPPIWVGGRSPAAMRRAGRLGDGYLSHMATPEHYAANLEAIAAAARDAGRPRVDFATAAFFFTWIDDSEEKAARAASAELERIYARPFGEAVRRYCLLGPPDAVRARMQEYIDAGVRHFVIAPMVDHALVTERMASDVRPGLRPTAPARQVAPPDRG